MSAIAMVEAPIVACSWCQARTPLDRTVAAVRLATGETQERTVWFLPGAWREFYVGDGSRQRFACGVPCGARLDAVGTLVQHRDKDSTATLEDLRDAILSVLAETASPVDCGCTSQNRDHACLIHGDS